MIRTLALLILLIGMACQSTDVEPTKLLYKTWERQSGTYQGQAWPPTYGQLTVVRFNEDGRLTDEVGRQYGGCCGAGGFVAKPDSILFHGDGLSHPECMLIRCVGDELLTGQRWRITKLTATDLVLTANQQEVVYKALR
ncbi:hypothetical protein [Fibrella aestuarina]|uniref:hypothetical protein n=1 Tax=Fibrella aestuarina TaxID=651143 RepID=UPI0003105A62|nr:hypothetical protein [Fibrella aestuarina]